MGEMNEVRQSKTDCIYWTMWSKVQFLLTGFSISDEMANETVVIILFEIRLCTVSES
jgi:hypothetical protein